jgi:hypothetical protein
MIDFVPHPENGLVEETGEVSFGALYYHAVALTFSALADTGVRV